MAGWPVAFEEAGVRTAVPALPGAEAPDADRWAATVSAVVGIPDHGSIVVAHSLGCLTVLRHLCSIPESWQLGRLVLVSGFIDTLPALPELDNYINRDTDLAQISHRIDRLSIIRSDADPYVPTGHTDRLADLLGVTAQIVAGAGHFLESDGVTSLPEAWAAASA
ncbi:RBBP9/YdeN family alpha/beta hydrolase [Streptomyces anulatus]